MFDMIKDKYKRGSKMHTIAQPQHSVLQGLVCFTGPMMGTCRTWDPRWSCAYCLGPYMGLMTSDFRGPNMVFQKHSQIDTVFWYHLGNKNAIVNYVWTHDGKICETHFMTLSDVLPSWVQT